MTHGSRQTLERAADLCAEAIEPLTAGGEEAWGTAAERTARVLAEINQRPAGSASEPTEALASLLRRQERFLRAAERVERRQKNIRVDIERYRQLVWHPPAEPGRLFEHLERLEALRRELRQGLQELSESSAGAVEMLRELVDAEAAAADSLAARGVALQRFFGENEQRLRAALDAIEPVAF
jgi:chromosome segregation ATPase